MVVKFEGHEYYNLYDIPSERSWNYDKPTFVESGRKFTYRHAWLEATTMRDKLIQIAPLFDEISLDGLALFGGSVIDLMLGRSPSDFDLVFFHEGTPAEQGVALRNRVEEFVAEVICHAKSYREESRRRRESGEKGDRKKPVNIEDIIVTRRYDTYNIVLPNNEFCDKVIQIKHSPNLHSLMESIDLDCCAVAYFKDEIYMPLRAKVSLESLTIPINPKDSSRNHLSRLIKYYNKGFDIILPDLDVAKLDQRNLPFGEAEVLDLPFINAVYDEVTGNKISLRRISLSDKCVEEQRLPSGLAGYCSHKSTSVGSMVRQNIRSLVHGDYDELVTIGQGEKFRDVFRTEAIITDRMLINCYSSIKYGIFKNGAIKLGDLESNYPCRKIENMMKELLVDYAAQRTDEKCDEIFATKDFSEHVKKYLEELTKEQIEVAKKMKAEYKGSLDLKNRAELDLSCTAEEWYGVYLKQK